MSSALFVVRAIVSDPAKRAEFDGWYSREHLPDAMKAFGVGRAGLERRRSCAASGDLPIRRPRRARSRHERGSTDRVGG